MKKIILSITLSIILSMYAFATVFTVNNSITTPGNPGQFSTISAAFDAASAGDTILIKGSTEPYTFPNNSTLLINKRICIIGEGYKPNNGTIPPTIVNGTLRFSSNSASGSSIWGINGQSLNIYVSTGIRLSNITIRRNHISNLQLPDSSNNYLIAENIMRDFPYFTPGPGNTQSRNVNLKIFNNIFYELANTAGQYSGNLYAYQVKNNLFLNGSHFQPLSSSPTRIFTSGSSAARCQNAIFENNIFYNVLPAANSGSSSLGPFSCSFINNITFCGVTNPLLSSLIGNSFSGNLDNTDPGYTNLFTNIAQNKVITSYDLNSVRLPNSSPAKNAGSDASDIGPTGGAYPIYAGSPLSEQLSGEPPLPQVRSANFTNNINAVQSGGSLQINVTGRKRN